MLWNSTGSAVYRTDGRNIWPRSLAGDIILYHSEDARHFHGKPRVVITSMIEGVVRRMTQPEHLGAVGLCPKFQW